MQDLSHLIQPITNRIVDKMKAICKEMPLLSYSFITS